MKSILLCLVLLSLSLNLSANMPEKHSAENLQFTDIIRNEKDEIVYLNQGEAERYCSDKGMRLPTIRELAQLATRMGAKGISDTPKTDYQAIRSTKDLFYYSPTGYAAPSDPNFRVSQLWSSSAYYEAIHYFWVLIGYKGELDAILGTQLSRSFVCVIENQSNFFVGNLENTECKLGTRIRKACSRRPDFPMQDCMKYGVANWLETQNMDLVIKKICSGLHDVNEIRVCIETSTCD